MKFAIIAAGEGSRLANEGINAPKPLVEVGGEKLIDRLLRIFTDCRASEIDVICNDLTPYVDAHLTDIEQNGLNGKHIPLRHIVKSTPSSMHSFFELSSLIGDEPFVMTTVEMEMMMFGRQIFVPSYIYAAGLTLLFAVLVNFAMYYKLKRVEMVESLKSVD